MFSWENECLVDRQQMSTSGETNDDVRFFIITTIMQLDTRNNVSPGRTTLMLFPSRELVPFIHQGNVFASQDLRDRQYNKINSPLNVSLTHRFFEIDYV